VLKQVFKMTALGLDIDTGPQISSVDKYLLCIFQLTCNDICVCVRVCVGMYVCMHLFIY
jgi:hypothetical protein